MLRILALILSILLRAGLAFADPTPRFEEAIGWKINDVVQVRVSDLRPTQARLGFQEVKEKEDDFKSMDRDERQRYLKTHPIPVVVGPRGALYAVDHQHQARALLESGHQKIVIEIIANLSQLPESAFWTQMKDSHWVYLHDDVMGIQISPKDLPDRIEDMRDDPFRSLAGQLRDAGGFIKRETTFYVEFVWARALRAYFTYRGYPAEHHWGKKDLARAMDFAKSPGAVDLPGNLIQPVCGEIFKNQ